MPPMTEDRKTIILIILLAFFCFLVGITASPIYKIYGLDGAAAVQGGLSMAGIFLALLARTHTEPASVTVENTKENPVVTEPVTPEPPTTEPTAEPVTPTEPAAEPTEPATIPTVVPPTIPAGAVPSPAGVPLPY